jgi:hypothetical protein
LLVSTLDGPPIAPYRCYLTSNHNELLGRGTTEGTHRSFEVHLLLLVCLLLPLSLDVRVRIKLLVHESIITVLDHEGARFIPNASDSLQRETFQRLADKCRTNGTSVDDPENTSCKVDRTILVGGGRVTGDLRHSLPRSSRPEPILTLISSHYLPTFHQESITHLRLTSTPSCEMISISSTGL